MVFEWRFIVMLIISKDKSTKKMVGLSDICDSKQFILPCDGAHFHVDPSNAMPYSITLDQCLKCVWYHDLPWAFQALVTTSAFETSEGYPLHQWKKIQHIVIEQLSYISFTCKASFWTYGTYRISLRVSTKQPRMFQLVAPSCKKSPPDHCQWTPPQGQSGTTHSRSILTDWHQVVRVWSFCFRQSNTTNNFHSVEILNICIYKHVQCSFRHAQKLDSVRLLPELQESEALYLSNIQSNN